MTKENEHICHRRIHGRKAEMDNKLLLLMNKTMYPAEFELLRELGQVFDQLDLN